ncbi:MAG: S1 RNA-binding domain-containing protein [Anaerolineae bacterium]|nr:S1 RNA-binding domain-containing protein [Anaerolineae bacterium]MBL6965835.1 S1 RNA-binding domain-containing protein [Anaerolineales bacterium]
MDTKPTRMEELKPKDKLTGTVIKTMLSGVVIDIGMEVPGIVHISRIQSEPVNRAEDVVEIGQEVEVWIRQVFPDRERIELTMIRPLGLEWREITKGMVSKGIVTRLEKYGAFIDIGAERPGLVHISEMAHGFIDSPGDVVQDGDEVEVQVLSVNRRRKQIKLSMKALMDPPVKTAKIVEEINEEVNNEPVPTAMEAALRQAMERSQNGESKGKKKKKGASLNDELESIFSRTLNKD